MLLHEKLDALRMTRNGKSCWTLQRQQLVLLADRNAEKPASA